MEYDQDLLRIGGGWFLHLASKANKLSAGRIELAGDLEETVEYNYPLSASGSHTLAVVGTGPQHLHLDSRNSRLGTVDTRYVIGKAVFLLFPGPDEQSKERDFGRIGLMG